MVSVSKLTPCPSNGCQILPTMLVYVLVFCVSFLQVAQQKAPAFMCRPPQAGTVKKGFCCDITHCVTHSQSNSEVPGLWIWHCSGAPSVAFIGSFMECPPPFLPWARLAVCSYVSTVAMYGTAQWVHHWSLQGTAWAFTQNIPHSRCRHTSVSCQMTQAPLPLAIKMTYPGLNPNRWSCHCEHPNKV